MTLEERGERGPVLYHSIDKGLMPFVIWGHENGAPVEGIVPSTRRPTVIERILDSAMRAACEDLQG